ncbi:hypothetical protein AMECASPLE_009214 [Ameca splendens]|uniref:Transmembrane protein n=1 Tax=Ameca splendens TaxID=208324 RepID=A0ABV0ZX28_9TELE
MERWMEARPVGERSRKRMVVEKKPWRLSRETGQKRRGGRDGWMLEKKGVEGELVRRGEEVKPFFFKIVRALQIKVNILNPLQAAVFMYIFLYCSPHYTY